MTKLLYRDLNEIFEFFAEEIEFCIEGMQSLLSDADDDNSVDDNIKKMYFDTLAMYYHLF